jgi:LysM repeat protein
MKKTICILIFFSLIALPISVFSVRAAPLTEVSASELISLINGMRTGQGLPALEIDNILMYTAQQTSDIMAVNDIHAHIGDVSGRAQAAGYGGGAKVWATENFAIGPMSIGDIQAVWADDAHMIPVVNANYTHIGAGVTSLNGRTWYIVHAAYTSGAYIVKTPVPGATAAPTIPAVSQLIIPVEIATPNPDGSIIHEVLSGQALWSIAIAYDTKIDVITGLNGLAVNDPIIQVGQKLLISAAQFTQTPTLAEGETPLVTATEEIASTSRPTSTLAPTKIKTPRPTNTKSIEEMIPTAVSTSEKPSAVNFLFDNRAVGVILVVVLALGILLMVSGSFSKMK